MCYFNYCPSGSHKSHSGFHYPRNMSMNKITDVSFWNKKASSTRKLIFYRDDYCGVTLLWSPVPYLHDTGDSQQKFDEAEKGCEQDLPVLQ